MKPLKYAVGAALLGVAALGLSACVTAPTPIGSDFRAPSETASILIMEPDVEVTFVTTGGAEPRADWAEQAESNLLAALRQELAESGETVVLFDPNAEQSEETQQALLLHQAVTSSLAAHVVFVDIAAFAGALPHQSTQREIYTLGDSVRHLAPGQDADYALFLTSRSQIESGGLFMTKVLIGAATGYVPASATFRGTSVSVVDLRTGEVVWLGAWNSGDPRNPDEAESIISQIFRQSPFARTTAR